MGDDIKREPKSIKASLRQQQGALISGLLEGDRGSGKSRFLIELHKMNVEDAWEKLGYPTKSRKEWKELWEGLADIEHPDVVSEKERELVRKAAKRCKMCVIDFDMEGCEQLLMRMNIMPPEIADTWEKWPVTGDTKDVDDEEYEHRFDEGHRALHHYLKRLRKHAEKYPKFAAQRVLVLEDCGEMADTALNHYFFVTTKGRTKDFAEHFAKTQTKAETEGKNVGLFQRGQRDTFGMVNLEIKDFVHECIMRQRDIGYNFYATTRIGYSKDKETGELKTYALGKTYIYEGFMDIVMAFIKTEVKKKGKRKEKFIIDTMAGAKNRLCPAFFMVNKGPKAFFNRLVKERANDGVLSDYKEPKEKKEVKKDVTDNSTDG